MARAQRVFTTGREGGCVIATLISGDKRPLSMDHFGVFGRPAAPGDAPICDITTNSPAT